MTQPAQQRAELRLLIVEDDQLLRENLRVLLSGEPAMQVVAACASAEEALALLDSMQPDAMLSDLGLPAMSGVELIRKARAALPALDIVVLTVSEDREAVFAALKAGANGYIVKGATPRELVEALGTLRAGGAPMSPKIARLVVKTFHDTPPSGEILAECEGARSSGRHPGRPVVQGNC